MVEENISQEFRLKNKDEAKNYILEEINQNDLMRKNHKKVSTALNYIEHLLILAPAVTGCVSISVFASLIGINVVSSAAGLKISAITAEIKNYMPIIMRERIMVK